MPGIAPYLLLVRRRTGNHNIKKEDCSNRQETRTEKGRDPILAISRVGGCCCELLILLEGVPYGDACGSNIADKLRDGYYLWSPSGFGNSDDGVIELADRD